MKALLKRSFSLWEKGHSICLLESNKLSEIVLQKKLMRNLRIWRDNSDNKKKQRILDERVNCKMKEIMTWLKYSVV